MDGIGGQVATAEVPAGAPRGIGHRRLRRRYGVTRAITGAGATGGDADGNRTEADLVRAARGSMRVPPPVLLG